MLSLVSWTGDLVTAQCSRSGGRHQRHQPTSTIDRQQEIDDEQSVRDSATAAIACLLASLQRRGACEAANYSATLRSVN